MMKSVSRFAKNVSALLVVLLALVVGSGAMVLPVHAQQAQTGAAPATANGTAQKPEAAPLPPGVEEAAKRGERQAADFKAQLDELELKLSNPSITRDELGKLRTDIETVRENVRAADTQLTGPLKQMEDQLSLLGAAPKEGESEPDSVATQRAALTKVRDALAGARAQLVLLAGSAVQMSSRAGTLERERFFSTLLVPSHSVANPLLWSEGFKQAGTFAERVGLMWRGFHDGVAEERGPFMPWLVYATFLALIAASFVLCRMIARKARNGSPGEAEFRKYLRTVAVPIGYVLVTGVAVAVFMVGFSTAVESNPRVERFMESLVGILVAFAFARGVARSILSPGWPHWRVAPLSTPAAARWLALLTVAFALIGVHACLRALAETVNMEPGFMVAVNAATALALAILGVRLILTGRRDNIEPEVERLGLKPGFSWTSYLVQPVWLILIIAFGALVLGYNALGLYITTNLFIIAPAVALLYCLRRLSDAFVAQSLKSDSRISTTLKSAFSMTDKGINRAGIALNAFVDLLLLLLGLPLVLGLTSLTWVDIRSWLSDAFFGFQIGDITISLSSILLAVTVFVVGLALTRLVTGWLDRRVLAPTDMDAGVRNSLRTGAGYLALIIVVLMAFAAAGVNFSNIAIVAGALSVGIGFGLQSIVNNFVSGLILLAERPIKVGDWVQVSGGEGTVRKINVRSTEIETFDRCSIIVPNSSLISETVNNWTHGDLLGRVRVGVGVSYDADPKQVEEILLNCASEHPRAVAFPQPSVLFKEFGASSLDFELRVFINDVNWVAFTASDLRFSIFKALGDAGIEIPFPQRDVNLKGLGVPVSDAVIAPAAVKPASKTPAEERKRAAKKAAAKRAGAKRKG